jgi:hypothetical protein
MPLLQEALAIWSGFWAIHILIRSALDSGWSGCKVSWSHEDLSTEGMLRGAPASRLAQSTLMPVAASSRGRANGRTVGSSGDVDDVSA